MLEKASKLLKKDGVLIYSTCSFNKKEGSKQIKKFLENNQNFKIDPIKKIEAGNFYKLITSKGYFQSYPNDLKSLGGIDGFFIARLIKK